jgi:hypothetical protein
MDCISSCPPDTAMWQTIKSQFLGQMCVPQGLGLAIFTLSHSRPAGHTMIPLLSPLPHSYSWLVPLRHTLPGSVPCLGPQAKPCGSLWAQLHGSLFSEVSATFLSP